MSKKAVTITVYALIPTDEYEERLSEIEGEIERGLQMADATYMSPIVTPGIPYEYSDQL